MNRVASRSSGYLAALLLGLFLSHGIKDQDKHTIDLRDGAGRVRVRMGELQSGSYGWEVFSEQGDSQAMIGSLANGEVTLRVGSRSSRWATMTAFASGACAISINDRGESKYTVALDADGGIRESLKPVSGEDSIVTRIAPNDGGATQLWTSAVNGRSLSEVRLGNNITSGASVSVGTRPGIMVSILSAPESPKARAGLVLLSAERTVADLVTATNGESSLNLLNYDQQSVVCVQATSDRGDGLYVRRLKKQLEASIGIDDSGRPGLGIREGPASRKFMLEPDTQSRPSSSGGK